jgi:RNA polymerase sigma factor (sigma-70 family)
MLVNGFLASRRPWRREVFSAELPDEPARGPTGSPDEDGTRDMLRRALAQLPPSQRTIVVLRYWEDLSVEQTAAILGCSPATSRARPPVAWPTSAALSAAVAAEGGQR